MLNIVAFALVMLLLAFGFDILKLPAAISPDRPPLVQLVGLAALACLNVVIVWTVARDDFVRFGYGFRRVLGTYVVTSLICSAAFLARGLWDGVYVVDPKTQIDAKDAIGIAIAGQFCAMAFSSTYLLKKTDTSKVREFKRARRAIKDFVDAMIQKRLAGAAFATAFAQVEPDMTSLSETARVARAALDEAEANYASDYGKLSEKLAADIKQVPTASIAERIKYYLEHDREMLLNLVERKQL